MAEYLSRNQSATRDLKLNSTCKCTSNSRLSEKGRAERSDDLNDDDEAEEDGEKDYLELVEYIRIAVQLIFSDLDPMEKAKPEATIH